jgi:hypothetical protein
MDFEYEGTLTKIKKAVGDGGDPPDTSYTGDCVIGNDTVVMWFPEHKDDPLGIRNTEYTSANNWEFDETEEHTVNGEETEIINVAAYQTIHKLDARKVRTVADALGMALDELMDLAQMTDKAEHYPIVFDLSEVEGHYGRVMVAPILPNEGGEGDSTTGVDGENAAEDIDLTEIKDELEIDLDLDLDGGGD